MNKNDADATAWCDTANERQAALVRHTSAIDYAVASMSSEESEFMGRRETSGCSEEASCAARLRRRITNAMAAATTRVTTDETTDAATTVAMELDVAESDEGNPASAAVAAATRSYKQTGFEGEDADMTQRTSGWSISQLSTFCFIGAAVASQSGSQAPQLQSQPSFEP